MSETTTKKTTSRKTTIAGLIAMGWTPCHWHSAAKRYEVFGKIGKPFKMLIGRSGAVRKMYEDGTIASSLSFTGSKYHEAICQVGEQFPNGPHSCACDVYRCILNVSCTPIAG